MAHNLQVCTIKSSGPHCGEALVLLQVALSKGEVSLAIDCLARRRMEKMEDTSRPNTATKAQNTTANSSK